MTVLFNKSLVIAARRGHVSASIALGGGLAGPPAAPPGTPLLWYKASTSNCYSDAGITPVADGGGVYQWDDLGSTELDVQQVNAANRPVYRASFGGSGYPALDFDTATQHYMTKAGEPDMTGAVTVLAAVYLDASGAGEIINSFMADSAIDNQLRFAVQEADDYVVFGRPYGTGDVVGSEAVTRSAWRVVAAKVGAATGSADTLLWANGSDSDPGEAETLNDDGTQNAGDLWIGRFDSQFFDANMDGGIGEILVYDSELSEADMAEAIAYLEGQYGL